MVLQNVNNFFPSDFWGGGIVKKKNQTPLAASLVAPSEVEVTGGCGQGHARVGSSAGAALGSSEMFGFIPVPVQQQHIA